MQPFIT